MSLFSPKIQILPFYLNYRINKSLTNSFYNLTARSIKIAMAGNRKPRKVCHRLMRWLKLYFYKAEKDLRRDTWVSVEEPLLHDRDWSVSMLSAPTTENDRTPPHTPFPDTFVTCNIRDRYLSERAA